MEGEQRPLDRRRSALKGADPAAPRRPLADAVAEYLQGAILDGEFRAGDRLPAERELAEQLHVNRSSVREALKKLQQLRLVEIQQGSGIRVRDLEEASFDLIWSLLIRGDVPDRRWLRGVLELREAVLPGMLRLAMGRSTAAELKEAAEAVRSTASPSISDGDLALGLRLLQDRIARLTRNPVLILLSNELGRLVNHLQAGPVSLGVVDDRRPLLPLLQRLAVALEARDVDTAERSMRDLSRRLGQSVLGRMGGAAGTR